MSRRVEKVCLLLFCLALLGCGETVCPPRTGQPPGLTPAEQQVVSAYNAFGLNLFREIAGSGGDENIFVSPVSVSMALGMTMNGAAGATEEAMKKTLGFSGMPLGEIDQCFKSLIDLLTGLDSRVDFRVANSIWYREEMTFQQAFFDTCRYYFGAEIAGLDFSDPAAADAINAWVAESTNGRIDEIVGKPVDPAIIMYLINAIYFKGAWTYQFDPAFTRDSDFTLPDGSQAPCKMMEQPEPGETSKFMYFAGDGLEAIDLPYADGWFSMTVILPGEGRDIDSVIEDLDAKTWSAWLAGLAEREGSIAMPRFKLEYEERLNDVLALLGMGVAFTPAADFSRMREGGGLWISEVKHKTFVEVNEEGTEAAAVTSVGMTDSVPETFAMRVDRPFVFAIRERHSGTILFIGKIGDPGFE